VSDGSGNGGLNGGIRKASGSEGCQREDAFKKCSYSLLRFRGSEGWVVENLGFGGDEGLGSGV
jgi:hypothetical protein